jgi:two-component system nitrogen regulation response regulator NtrX
VKATVLVVDDESNITASVAQLLELEGYQVLEANSGRKGLDVLEDHEADLVLLDVKLPDLDGLSVLREIKKKDADMPVVMMSAYGTIETAVEATKAGAYDFLEKPLGSEKTLLAVENALRLARLSSENRELRQRAGEWPSMIGQSPQMKELFKQIEVTAPTASRVLLLGESGTGKELVARAIHEGSPRREADFVTVNCAAVPSELIESELFGHERGAFTGASKARRGKFERADGGTLLLDEVGDMPLPMQAKLLRVLEEGEFERVGGGDQIKVDVRVVAASNKNLEEEVRKGSFRLDLFHRLNVVPIQLPPLRDRKGDIRLLAEHFLSQFTAAEATEPAALTDEAMERLTGYPWPGNVRELRNVMERVGILFPGKKVSAAQLAQALPRAEDAPAVTGEGSGRLKETMRAVEKQEILKALERNKWHMTRAAEELGLERSHLYKKMRAHGISRD